jgi:hypothetical protein
MFLSQVIQAASTGLSIAPDTARNASDDDYEFDTTPATVNEAMSTENRVKIEAVNYLQDPSNDSIHIYPSIL